MYNEWPTTPAPPTTTSKYVNVDTHDGYTNMFLVEIIVPVAVVILVIVSVSISLVRRFCLKPAENVNDVNKQNTRHYDTLHHSREVTYESLITPQLYPYDVVDAYTQMPTPKVSRIVKINPYEGLAITSGSTNTDIHVYNEPANQEITSDVIYNDSLSKNFDGVNSYADKRKQRERAVANLDRVENNDDYVISKNVNADATYENADDQSLEN